MTIGVRFVLILRLKTKPTFTELNREISECRLCPRLTTYREKVAREKKREFRDWEYWGKPVPGFGDPQAKLWIVGLAPAAHGANRTGRMFTGDSSGNWLYRELHRIGLASISRSTSKDDGQMLSEVFISATARCAPPDNKPLPQEIYRCTPYLDVEFALLKNVTHFLVLGRIAFDSVINLLARQGYQRPSPKWKFKHGARYTIGNKTGDKTDYKTLWVSYHPSRQNTQTGRLTEAMWTQVFMSIKKEL